MCSTFYQNSRLTFVCMSISTSPTREWLGLMLLLVLSIFHPLSTVLPFHCCPICPRQTLLLECNIQCQLYLVQKLSQMISPIVSFSNSSHLHQQSGQQLLHAPHHTSHCTSVDLEPANFTIIWDYSAKKSKVKSSVLSTCAKVCLLDCLPFVRSRFIIQYDHPPPILNVGTLLSLSFCTACYLVFTLMTSHPTLIHFLRCLMIANAKITGVIITVDKVVFGKRCLRSALCD